MQKIFLAFANSKENPLPALSNEDSKVHEYLSFREKKEDYSLLRLSSATVEEIIRYLILYQEEVLVFHYSGHADNEELVLEDATVNGTGIAQLLGRCKQLKLVVLNGCSTRGQVNRLFKAGVPAVIATSAVVGDAAASQFAISFYQSLATSNRTLGEAFKDGISAAKIRNPEIQEERSVGIFTEEREEIRAGRDMAGQKAYWGLYCKNEGILEWKLPVSSNNKISSYAPGRVLVSKLVEALIPYNNKIAELSKSIPKGSEHEDGELLYGVLRCLPHPISEQLRKLLASDHEGDSMRFYDKPDAIRLRQLQYTYVTIARLVVFILLADLWKQLETKEGIRPPEKVLTKLRSALVNKQEKYDYISLIQNLTECFEMYQFPYFMKEFKEINADLQEKTSFTTACNFFESMWDIDSIDMQNTEFLCAMAEEQLGIVLGKLAFLSTYSLISVRKIEVVRYRAPSRPEFRHKVVRLQQNCVRLSLKSENLDDFMDTSSVLLQRKNDNSFSYLNLIPFIIDQSAFEDKTGLTNFFFFEYYDQQLDNQYYRYVYKNDNELFRVRDQEQYQTLRGLFDSFSITLFTKNLKDL